MKRGREHIAKKEGIIVPKGRWSLKGGGMAPCLPLAAASSRYSYTSGTSAAKLSMLAVAEKLMQIATERLDTGQRRRIK